MNMVIKMNTVPESQIQIEGLNVLKTHLGVVNTIKFLEQFDNGGTGDYTKEKYDLTDAELTKEEILNLFELKIEQHDK